MAADVPPVGSTDDLPQPDSEEIQSLVKGKEAREAYRWLWQNRTDPKPMSDWVERSQGVFGKTNSNAGRRLRELYATFEIRRYRHQGERAWVYQIVSRKEKPLDTVAISKRLEVEVFTIKGRYCAMCGRGPVDGIKLQIDHIIPREWGGLTVLDNLEPLCAEHNHGKKAFFSSFDDVGPIIRHAMSGEDPWMRIGELLRRLHGISRECPVELIFLVAKETHKGDPLKRLRELRFVLGWPIKPSRSKDSGGVTHVSYKLTCAPPAWPDGGPAKAVLEYERQRRIRKNNSAN